MSLWSEMSATLDSSSRSGKLETTVKKRKINCGGDKNGVRDDADAFIIKEVRLIKV